MTPAADDKIIIQTAPYNSQTPLTVVIVTLRIDFTHWLSVSLKYVYCSSVMVVASTYFHLQQDYKLQY